MRRNAPLQDQFTLHGIELISAKKGIEYVDLGVAGAQFTQLKSRANLVLDQVRALKPDLIICSFGTNEAYNLNWDARLYERSLIQFSQDIKSVLPQSVFLWTSPPDTRSQKRVPRYQNQLVQLLSNQAFPFYDLNAVMGGFGSSSSWVKKGYFLKDQVHLTKEGYQLQAKLFVLALLKSWGDQASLEPLLDQVNKQIISGNIPN
jgi:lysophospholipase L1-like esterase